MIYDKAELSRYASKNGFARDSYEKMCRQSEILSLIYSDDLLSDSLALKGGTAINIAFLNAPRLSLDLDLDLTKNVSREDMLILREQICKRTSEIMDSLGYEFDGQHSKDTHALYSMVFSYTNAGGNKDRLKIEMNCMLRQHLLPFESCETLNYEGFTPCQIQCVNPLEIYAAKIVALSTRATARDMFDVHNMIKSGLLSEKEDLEMLRKCAIFYAVLNSEQPFYSFDFSNFNNNLTMNKVRQTLFPVLHQPVGRYDLDNVKSEINQFAESNLNFTEREMDYIDKFFDGSYEPDLLELCDCDELNHHPMVEWKMKNIRKALGLSELPKKNNNYDYDYP